MTKATWNDSFLLCCMKTCYTFQLKLHLVAAILSNDVINIVSFRQCLYVDFS
jgi:hypothetical protein